MRRIVLEREWVSRCLTCGTYFYEHGELGEHLPCQVSLGVPLMLVPEGRSRPRRNRRLMAR
jgi:hypothetical protein